MILSGSKIEKCVREKTIDIRPFNKSQINPNSYNYRLGDYLKIYEEEVLDVKKNLRQKKYILQMKELFSILIRFI